MTDADKELAEILARHERHNDAMQKLPWLCGALDVITHADRATLLRRLDEAAAQLREAHALIGTVRSMAGCDVRNVSDIDYEAHSREIGDAIEAREKRLGDVFAGEPPLRVGDLLSTAQVEAINDLRAALAPEVKP